MADPLLVRAAAAEAGDRAPDRALAAGEAQPLGDAGAEAVDDDVRAQAQGACEGRVGSQVADDRLLTGVERPVPGWVDEPKRVTFRRLHGDDTRAQPEQLPGRERAGHVARQVHDEHSLQCGHGSILAAF